MEELINDINFFGRKNELETLSTIAISMEIGLISIVGEHRIGTTTLMNAFSNKSILENLNIIPPAREYQYFDCREFTSIQSLLLKLVKNAKGLKE